MRNVLLIALLTFTVVAGGAYCITWFVQAAQIKSGIEAFVAQVNQHQTYLTYESIETSGFPFTVETKVVRPHFQGRVDQLLTAVEAAGHQHAIPGQMHTLPEWTENWLLNGSITFGINALASRYTLRVSGDWQSSGGIAGTALPAMATQTTGDFTCELGLKNHFTAFTSLWDVESLSQRKELLNDLELFDCITPAYVLFEQASREPLLQSGPGRIYVTHDRSDSEQWRLFLKSENSEITSRGDNLLTLYTHAMDPAYPFPVRLSVYGKQNVEMDFTYDGPAEWPKGSWGMTPIDIRLAKFDIANQAYEANSHFHLSNGGAGATRTGSLVFGSQMQFSARYDALTQDVARNFVYNLYHDDHPQMLALRPHVQQYSEEEMLSILYPAIPDFHALGKLVQTMDVSVKGSADFKTADITMPSFELSATPYGITGKGSARLSPELPVPAANVALDCRNCPSLVDDIFAYASRLRTVIARFNPQQADAMEFNPQLPEGIKRFLAALASPAQANSSAVIYHYAVVSDHTGVNVNGMTMDIVMRLYAEHIAPFLNKAKPASQTPTRSHG